MRVTEIADVDFGSGPVATDFPIRLLRCKKIVVIVTTPAYFVHQPLQRCTSFQMLKCSQTLLQEEEIRTLHLVDLSGKNAMSEYRSFRVETRWNLGGLSAADLAEDELAGHSFWIAHDAGGIQVQDCEIILSVVAHVSKSRAQATRRAGISLCEGFTARLAKQTRAAGAL